MGSSDSRTRILETAREHFLKRSYTRTTLREVARDAGVTTGSLYHHFAGKDELFVEVCVEGMRNLLRRLRTATELTAGRPLSERAVALFDAYASFYVEERAYFELVEQLELDTEHLNISDVLAARVKGVSQQILEEMVEMLQQADPTLERAEVQKRVLLTVAMAEGLVGCHRKGHLQRFGLALASFRGLIIDLAKQLVPGRP